MKELEKFKTSKDAQKDVKHLKEFSKSEYNVKSLDYIVDTIINDGDLPNNTIGIIINHPLIAVIEAKFKGLICHCNQPPFGSSNLDKPFGWSQRWTDIRSVIVLKIVTDEGISGWGETYGSNDSLDEISDTLMHEFISEPVPSGGPVPFTGLALNSDTNTFYTVPSYLERGISITSRTIIALPVLSNTT